MTNTVLHQITTAGGIAESTLTLPPVVSSAFLTLRVRGDFSWSLEYVNLFIDGQQVGGNLGHDFADDGTFRVALSKEDITTLLSGKTSVVLKTDATESVNFRAPGMPAGVFAECEWTIVMNNLPSAVFDGKVGIGTIPTESSLSIGKWNEGDVHATEDGTTQLLLSGIA